jgi:hypothetical protein
MSNLFLTNQKDHNALIINRCCVQLPRKTIVYIAIVDIIQKLHIQKTLFMVVGDNGEDTEETKNNR